MITDNDFWRELEFRPAYPAGDLDTVYNNLYKASIEAFVRELNHGVWPEESRYHAFKTSFGEPGMTVISHRGQVVGCFCIAVGADKVMLRRMYLLPDYRRRGIGGYIVGSALERAHAVRLPLELDTLVNNLPAIRFYTHMGFHQAGDVRVNGWSRKLLMRHMDTDRYLKNR